jgi:hypothetical protein
MRSVLCVFVVAAAGQAASAGVVYSNIPGVLNANYPSVGYQATSTREFGDRVGFAGTDRDLQSVTATMSSWAHQEDFDPSGTVTSYNHPLTMNIYAAGSGMMPGALLGSVTQTFAVPYRPVGYSANGIAFNVTFNFASLGIVLPDHVVYGLAFNTQTHGYSPTGVSGPYNSLNFAVNGAALGGISVGSNDDLDDTMANSTWTGFYTDGGAAGLGVFRQDTGWTGYTPMAEFNAVPTPAGAAVLAIGVLSTGRRRRKD